MKRASNSTIPRLATFLTASILVAAGAVSCSSSSTKTPPADAAPDAPGSDGGSNDKSSAADVAPDAPGTDGPAPDAPGTDVPAADAPRDTGADVATDVATTDALGTDGGAGDATTTTAATGLVNPRTVPVGASTPLAVATGAMLPANNATGVPADTLLRIGFDAAPTVGATGTIVIHLADTNGTVVDTINLADPYAIYDGTAGRLTTNLTSTKLNAIGGPTANQARLVNYIPILISGNTATIVPHNNKLAYNTAYYVTIDAGALTGAIAATPFAGITSTTAWTFTTKAAKPATLNVAADNSADFATVQGAIDAIAIGSTVALTINIAPGVYQEMLFIRNKSNMTFLGTNNGVDTVIQYDNSDGFNPSTGGGQTVPLPATGNLVGGGRAVMLTSGASGIVLDSITLKNLHGQASRVLPTLPTPTTFLATDTTSPTFTGYNGGTQAETIYFNTTFAVSAAGVASAGTLVAKHSNFVSYQDTVQLKGFVWFYDCFVTGDTDFIWGNANTALFERCEIKSRANTNSPSVVQSRAYLGSGNVSPPANFNISYGGFVFLNSALTKEAGTFTAYLARSAGATLVANAAAPFLYQQYDIVSYINCTMDTHIAAVGWNTAGSTPPGPNVAPSAVTGWREYGSLTPSGQPVNVSTRLAAPNGGSIQLSAANVATFFPDRATILHGATDGTLTTTGLATFTPAP